MRANAKQRYFEWVFRMFDLERVYDERADDTVQHWKHLGRPPVCNSILRGAILPRKFPKTIHLHPCKCT